MKGNFLILLVTANTTYTTFHVVYTKIMLYTQQVLFSQSDQSCLYRDTSCISMNTDVYVVYPQLHPVYAQIRVVSQHIQLYIQGHMLCTYGHNISGMLRQGSSRRKCPQRSCWLTRLGKRKWRKLLYVRFA